MPIIKSIKPKTGFPHRVHRSKRGRKPAKKYHARKATRAYIALLKKKAEERAEDT